MSNTALRAVYLTLAATLALALWWAPLSWPLKGVVLALMAPIFGLGRGGTT